MTSFCARIRHQRKSRISPAEIVILAALACSISSGDCRAQGSADEQAAQIAQSLVKRHEAWSKISTPGASIRAVESSRQGGVVRYELFASGLPTDKLYTVVEWPVTKPGPVTLMEGVSLGTDGLVSCTGQHPGECNDPDISAKERGAVDFVFQPVDGEPFRIALVNGDSRAAIIIVPNPIFSKDGGCTLEVVRLTPRFELAYFAGSGYPPNAEVTFNSESYGEKRNLKTTADEKGAIRFAELPFVAGHSSGTMKIAATGMACSPSMKFNWGQP
jgi:hypothetical protein